MPQGESLRRCILAARRHELTRYKARVAIQISPAPREKTSAPDVESPEATPVQVVGQHTAQSSRTRPHAVQGFPFDDILPPHTPLTIAPAPAAPPVRHTSPNIIRPSRSTIWPATCRHKRCGEP